MSGRSVGQEGEGGTEALRDGRAAYYRRDLPNLNFHINRMRRNINMDQLGFMGGKWRLSFL